MSVFIVSHWLVVLHFERSFASSLMTVEFLFSFFAPSCWPTTIVDTRYQNLCQCQEAKCLKIFSAVIFFASLQEWCTNNKYLCLTPSNKCAGHSLGHCSYQYLLFSMGVLQKYKNIGALFLLLEEHKIVLMAGLRLVSQRSYLKYICQ